MNRKKKYLYALHIINYCARDLEKYLDLKIVCHDGDEFMVNSLLMAALSPFVRDYLKELDQTTCKEPLIVVPDLNSKHLDVFFK